MTSRATLCAVNPRAAIAAALVLLMAAPAALAVQVNRQPGVPLTQHLGTAGAPDVEPKLHVGLGLPTTFDYSVGSSATATAGANGSSSLQNTLATTFTVVADPGDPPDVSVCLTYDFTGDASATVNVPTGSVAGGSGGTAGFAVSVGPPAAVTAPSPATLTVTPAVGPVRTLFSLPGQTFATTSAQSIQLKASGGFRAIPGDVIAIESTFGVAEFVNSPAGAAQGQARSTFKLDACKVEVVPTLSGPPSAMLLVLLVLAASLASTTLRRRN